MQLEPLEGGFAVPKQCDLERCADSQQLQYAEHVSVEVRDPSPDQIGKPDAWSNVSVPAPDPAFLGQLLVLEPVEEQLAQEHDVPARELPQAVEAPSVDGTVEHRREQLLDRRARKLADVQQHAQLVLPQRLDRVGHWRPGPHGDHGKRLASRHELMQQRRRAGIE